MPVHDWTKVDAGTFHDFHYEWVRSIKAVLNGGLLPPSYYAQAEQITSGVEPDVVTLHRPAKSIPPLPESGGVALATVPPRVRFRIRAEEEAQYATKANCIAIRHRTNHRVIAVIELVSPGNKNSQHGLNSFVTKATEMLRAGVHLLILDLFPPSVRDPQGIHKAIWDKIEDSDFTLPEDQPLTLVSYIGGPLPEAFIEPTRVGATLPEMPLFLSTEHYIPVPLASTYQAAWESVPEFWRNVIEGRETA